MKYAIISWPARARLEQTPDVQLCNEIYRAWPYGPRNIVDRTGTITFPVDLGLMPGMTIPQNLGRTNYRDAMLARAEDLRAHARALGVPIAFFWSGGIDSTAALTAMILAGATRSELFVVTGPAAIEERRGFYLREIKPRFDRFGSDDWHEMLSDKCMIVTGELGDQMMGPIGLWRQALPDLNRPYAETLREFFVRCGMSIAAADRWYELLDMSARKAPCRVQTLGEIMWWMIYTLYWQEASIRNYMYFTNTARAKALHEAGYQQHFYNSMQLQSWSMSSHDRKIGTTLESHKGPAKELIFSLDGDDHARRTALKRMSPMPQRPLVAEAIDVDFNYHKSIEIRDAYNPRSSFA